MSPLFVKRAGAAVLVLEVCYVLLMELAFALLVVDTSGIDHPGSEGAGGLLLVAEATAALVLLWAAAVLVLPALAEKGPRWARAAGLVAAAVLQVLGIRSATSNALAQDAGPDVVVNALMVLCALVAVAACVLGLRDASRRTAVRG
ncbi:hypothetical protein [Streptomyces sp. NPDC001744]|uniref:hypothetical protein n=1 Tax=Streptomyces sp. NPDC001744 TaxID=3364606 RepID=UPI0036B01F40